MRKPSILILHAAGTNRDQEAAFACELAGGAPQIVHVNELRAQPHRLDDYAMLIVPGGFSYGDALGAGTRLALDMQVYFQDAVQKFAHSGKPILGICNGFQALVKAGLLPGQANTERRQVTLTDNASGHFECRWIHLAVPKATRATRLQPLNELIFCPVAHGEGNFQTQDTATLQQLEANGLVAFRYVSASGDPLHGSYPANPNGSVGDIAGICNWQGNVIGLMPHPEDHTMPVQNPLGQQTGQPGKLGLALFKVLIGSL